MSYSKSLDVYNAMCDAENGFDSGALDRLTGNNSLSDDDDYDDIIDDDDDNDNDDDDDYNF